MVNPIHRISPEVSAADASETSQTPERLGGIVSGKPTTVHQETVALSGKAQLARAAADSAHRSNGVDSARVQAIRQALAQNAYQVSPSAIAIAVAQVDWLVRP